MYKGRKKIPRKLKGIDEIEKGPFDNLMEFF
jgi:hypothetical protein